jgi:hypothetical protein
MWKPRCLTTLSVSTASYRDGFTFTYRFCVYPCSLSDATMLQLDAFINPWTYAFFGLVQQRTCIFQQALDNKKLRKYIWRLQVILLSTSLHLHFDTHTNIYLHNEFRRFWRVLTMAYNTQNYWPSDSFHFLEYRMMEKSSYYEHNKFLSENPISWNRGKEIRSRDCRKIVVVGGGGQHLVTDLPDPARSGASNNIRFYSGT